MRFLFHYPELSGPEGDLLDTGPLLEVAVAAEQAGFDGFSLSEHPAPGARWLQAGGHQTLDPLVALGFVAAVTDRMRLVTNLVVVPYRNPLLLAKAAATVDKLSGGRLTMGLGAGYLKSEFFALGVDWDERNALFDEALDVLPHHWRGEPFTYAGRHFDARDVLALPRPPQGSIPLWIGGNSALSRRRAAQRAQGWMPMAGPAELTASARTPPIASTTDLAGKIREVRDAASEAGRTEAIDVAFSYPDRSIVQPTVDVERHRTAIAELEEAGVTWLVVSAGFGDPQATFDFLAGFAETYRG